MGWVPRYHPPFPSICKLLAAFLRSSFVFARSLQHFKFLTTSLSFTRYMLPFLRPTQHTDSLKVPTWRLRATYSHIYMCYVSISYLLPVYSDDTTRAQHLPYLPYLPMMPCKPYRSYLSYIPHILYIWSIVTTPTYHTYNSKHTCHTYHSYLT